MQFKTLDIERHDDRIAIVTINRPSKLNAMNHAFFAELSAALSMLDADPTMSVCILTGAGRAFSVGGDFADFDALSGPEDYRRQVHLALSAFHAVERAQTVVVGAVNGLALAGGTELTLACDMAIASERARFAFREVTVGLMPSFGIIRGPQVIGRPWTSWLALTGNELDAEEALRIGLVQQVSNHEDLLEDALELAGRIAAHPRLAVRTTKQMVNRNAAAGLNEAIQATAILFSNPEHKALIGGFLKARAERQDATDSPRIERTGLS